MMRYTLKQFCDELFIQVQDYLHIKVVGVLDYDDYFEVVLRYTDVDTGFRVETVIYWYEEQFHTATRYASPFILSFDKSCSQFWYLIDKHIMPQFKAGIEAQKRSVEQ